jgi:chorismate mutase
MDNRINEIRRKISSLRVTEASRRLMAKRAELLVLVGEWKAARDIAARC